MYIGYIMKDVVGLLPLSVSGPVVRESGNRECDRAYIVVVECTPEGSERIRVGNFPGVVRKNSNIPTLHDCTVYERACVRARQ